MKANSLKTRFIIRDTYEHRKVIARQKSHVYYFNGMWYWRAVNALFRAKTVTKLQEKCNKMAFWPGKYKK